ncbi:hypothetical protein [Imbroritus primus]|uniref:hypothetical protein n=1 Tax=Imbroritus primus TaxID=3058603 RepID=UPI003D16122A
MSHIIAGRFNTFPAAQKAARSLRARGFSTNKLSLFFVNPAGQHARFPIGGDMYADAGARHAGSGAFTGVIVGALAGGALGGLVYLSGVVNSFQYPVLVPLFAAGLGAYLGSLAGGLRRTRDPAVGRERDAGVMLAVQVDDAGTRGTAADVLRASGAMDIEDAEGEWRAGEWQDFDPRTGPEPGAARAAVATAPAPATAADAARATTVARHQTAEAEERAGMAERRPGQQMRRDQPGAIRGDAAGAFPPGVEGEALRDPGNATPDVPPTDNRS